MAAAVSNLTQGLAAQNSALPGASSAAGTRIAAGLPTPPDSLAPQHPASRVPIHPQLGNPSHCFYKTGDALDDASSTGSPQLGGLDGSGWAAVAGSKRSPDAQAASLGNATTAEQIAKFYLPKMLLYKGEKKIGQLMKELCDEAPAYAALEPPRRRRLMDAALAFSAGGGPSGSVTFTKTNWGLWKATELGHSSHKVIREWASASQRSMPSINEAGVSPPDSTLGSYKSGTISIPRRSKALNHRERRDSSLTHSTGASHSLPRPRDQRPFSHNVFNMDEDNDDAMSIDDDGDDDMAYVGYRHADDLELMDDGSDTEVEDWEALGPEKLRAASSVNSTGGGILPKYIAGRGRTTSRQAQSVPTAGALSRRLQRLQRGALPDVIDVFPTLDFSGTNFDEAEQAATEALLRMGSVGSRASATPA